MGKKKFVADSDSLSLMVSGSGSDVRADNMFEENSIFSGGLPMAGSVN